MEVKANIPDTLEGSSKRPIEPLKVYMATLEKAYVENAYKIFRTTRKAARALGIDHSTFIRKMKKYGISATKKDGKMHHFGD
ncbi:transcriptional regulator, Fis family [Pseudoramibacter alactolyticus ATCC 23263]|jgi:TyrR family helix-turn-helix protein|uniref:Transcriptional regulator, Fis family n=1 Tax=Pseudoramibacter alactolyticus ATCC 23263 TaxID=887929 RepID=E6ME35_9FIRM|nr:helix-turn-helix domain-containing protein [Pseudoramibacter alactolyticus]EFV02794.1 transcriptional regulator, Fis family [Pseudoramibacter alactolyticus ATCC 23263]